MWWKNAISGPRLRSYPAIFTSQGHINKVIPVSECLLLLLNKYFRKKIEIFGKFWDFQKILRFFKKIEIFVKFWDFYKISRFWENFEIFENFWDFWRIFEIFEKFWDFRKITIQFFFNFLSSIFSTSQFNQCWQGHGGSWRLSVGSQNLKFSKGVFVVFVFVFVIVSVFL